MKSMSGAKRLTGFDKPTVWSVMTPLAIKTQSMNLGQGFPSWSPPDFFKKNLQESVQTSSHQYTRAYGSLSLTKAIAHYHRNTFKNINPQTNIVTVAGGVQGLYCCFMGLVNEGEEVLIFDPSYDCYRPQVQMAGGRTVGIPLKPRNAQSKQQVMQRCSQGFNATQADDWIIDYELFQKAITPKTKVLLLNSPHNPIGKVFSQEQIGKLVMILLKYPNIIVVQDNVYQGMTFDDMLDKPLPKIAFQQGMQNRTVSVYSAGKMFSATGSRSGWIIGPADLIKSIRSVHQYTVFCAYNVIETAVEKSLNHISQPQNTYMHDYSCRLKKNRDILLQELIDSKFQFNLWIPKGGYFIIVDISKIQVMQKYKTDEEGNKLTKDYAFCIQLAYENKVVAIPCSSFYAKEDAQMGQNYIRFAFCKNQEMIRQAGKRMK